MRKLFLTLLCALAFVQGCSTFEDQVPLDDGVSEINLPKGSEEYGKAIAKEMRNIALNFSTKGIDYTQTNISPSVRNQVIRELYSDVPEVVKMKSSSAPISFRSSIPVENINALTEGQLRLIYKIADEYKNTRSEDELIKKLKSISTEIYLLPEIEQERVFNMSAALYYGLKEVRQLRKEGLMAPAGTLNIGSPRFKSFSEDGDGGSGTTGECKQKESAITLTLGTKIIIDGVELVVKESLWVAARALFVITACLMLTSDTPDYEARCNDGRDACVRNPWKNGVRLECQNCYQQCLHNRVWRCPVY